MILDNVSLYDYPALWFEVYNRQESLGICLEDDVIDTEVYTQTFVRMERTRQMQHLDRIQYLEDRVQKQQRELGRLWLALCIQALIISLWMMFV